MFDASLRDFRPRFSKLTPQSIKGNLGCTTFVGAAHLDKVSEPSRKPQRPLRSPQHLPPQYLRALQHPVAQSLTLRATKSAGRISGIAAHGAKPRGARHQHATTRPPKSPRWCNTVLVPQPATYPHPPCANTLSSVSTCPTFPKQTTGTSPRESVDALFAGRQALIKAADKRETAAEAECSGGGGGGGICTLGRASLQKGRWGTPQGRGGEVCALAGRGEAQGP
jgi:hypothetical protein